MFKLTPRGEGGGWTQTELFSFDRTGGEAPEGALLLDGAGNLYGTSSGGGAHNGGTVFKLSPPSAGQTKWTETVLYSFNNSDGRSPTSALIADDAGNLYGTTADGGTSLDGTVFELSPPAAGQTTWTQKVLFSFNGTNGKAPYAGLLADSGGNLYGTTFRGGPSDDGLVFKLSPPSSGQNAWTETVLTTFTGFNGGAPEGVPIADGAGNLYGTTLVGGASNDGIVFELSPPAAGQTAWTQTILVWFDGTNANSPAGGVIADGSGALYGTTLYNGDGVGGGTVFKVKPPAAGGKKWTEKVLGSFDTTNGSHPAAAPVLGSDGRLYGTAMAGGAHGFGTVFRIER